MSISRPTIQLDDKLPKVRVNTPVRDFFLLPFDITTEQGKGKLTKVVLTVYPANNMLLSDWLQCAKLLGKSGCTTPLKLVVFSIPTIYITSYQEGEWQLDADRLPTECEINRKLHELFGTV